MDIISTRDVAEVLGVSEATVKRWSDAGTLRCFRTPGGHRKFRLRDVKSFLSDQQGEASASSPPAIPSRELTPGQHEARKLALASDVDGLVSLVASSKLDGRTLAEIFDEILFPAMAEIGDAWSQGKLSSAQEHLASMAVSETLARVRPLVERSGRVDRGRALCACLGGEQHDIGVRMVSVVLGAEGFRASLLGANVPAGDLAMMLAGDKPDLLALSASHVADPETLRGDLAVVASAAAATRTRIIVGGPGFHRLQVLPSNVRRFGSLREMVSLSFVHDTPGVFSGR